MTRYQYRDKDPGGEWGGWRNYRGDDIDPLLSGALRTFDCRVTFRAPTKAKRQWRLAR